MNDIITPLHFLILTVAGWINEKQAQKIEFLCEQLEAYQRSAGSGRLPFTNDERRRLAGGSRASEIAAAIRSSLDSLDK